MNYALFYILLLAEEVGENNNFFSNWNGIIEVLIGAVIGFCSTVIMSFATKKIGIHHLIKKLRVELIVNRKNLYQIKDDLSQIVEFPSPIWNTIANSNILLDIGVKKYEKIINIYVAIRQVEKEEKNLTNQVTEEQKLIILKNRYALLKIIDENMI